MVQSTPQQAMEFRFQNTNSSRDYPQTPSLIDISANTIKPIDLVSDLGWY